MATDLRTAPAVSSSSGQNSNTIYFYSKIQGYTWLSNFSNHAFTLDGVEWPTVEHYFQAKKFMDEEDAEYVEIIRTCGTPGKAKQLGRSVAHKLRDDWEEAKEKIMRDALVAKFTQHTDLRAKLIATGSQRLVERSDADAYWGDGKHGHGKNRLGHLLMEVRDYLAANLDASDESSEKENDDADNVAVDEASAPVQGPPFKLKSHTTALDRAIKRKHKNRDRRNVWKDESGSSVFQIDNDDPSSAVLFKDSEIVVPLSALPEPAKHVMRKHQWVRKYSDNLDFEDDEDEDECDEDVAVPTSRMTLGSFLDKDVSLPPPSYTEFQTAADCIASARVMMNNMSAFPPNGDKFKALRQQCVELLPMLFGFVEQPQSDSVMMELLETIDALNTCNAV